MDRGGLLALYRWLLFLSAPSRAAALLVSRRASVSLRQSSGAHSPAVLLKLLQPCDANVMRDIAAFEACFESQRQAWRASADGLMVDAEIYAQPWGFPLEEIQRAGPPLAWQKGSQLPLATGPVVRRAPPALRRASGRRGRTLFAADSAHARDSGRSAIRLTFPVFAVRRRESRSS